LMEGSHFPPPPRRATTGDYWVEPMREVHKRFKGTRGAVAQFGDSITYSMAFWASIPHTVKGPEWRPYIEYVFEPSWRWKGPEFGCCGGWTSSDLLQAVEGALQRLKPEVAFIMVGTNDLGRNIPLHQYKRNLEAIVDKCLSLGCIPVLFTIPPMRGKMEAVREANRIVHEVALSRKVPLVPYFEEVMRRRPEDWDGGLFPGEEAYEVETLISRDGVHPSNPSRFVNVFTAEGLSKNGYTLRNYLALLAFKEVCDKILFPALKAGREGR